MDQKAGILKFLRKFSDLSDHILPGFTINEEALRLGNIPNLPNNFRDIEKSLIYRSSHPDDHREYIGMLPTLFSRHYKEVKCRSIYNLPNHDLNLLKVYNALAYFQKNGTEQSYTGKDFEIESYYNAYSYPQSDPRTSYETREDIPYQEYAEFFDFDTYGYHLDYLKLYKSLLEKVKNGEDITDYALEANSILNYQGWSYREMIRRAQEAVSKSANYKEPTGLRGIEKTGIFIQSEISPHGNPLGGIYESPHKKWVYIITFRTPTPKSEKEREHPSGVHALTDKPATIIYDSSTGEIKEIEGDAYGRCGFIDDIVELYKKVAAKEVFGKDYSFHMEFGFQRNKPLIFQLRQFSPFQVADFKVDEQHSGKYLVRGITDEVGEKVTITLLGEVSVRAQIQPSTNIGIKYRKVELNNNLPLRQRRVVAGTGWGRLDDDHGVTKLLYETGGIAIAGILPGLPKIRDHDTTQTYVGTLFSDGVNVVIEGVEEIG